MPKSLDDDVMPLNCDVMVFFSQFTTDLQPYESHTSNAWSTKFTFSLIVAFYLTETEAKLKNLKYLSYSTALSKGTIFAKKNGDF